MTTVSNKPEPPKRITPMLVSDSLSGNYARPTAGGNRAGGTPEGGSSNAPAGVVPGPDAYRPNLAGNVDPNPTISGAAIVAPVAQPDATGHPANAAGSKGTVGDSGPGLGQ
jgi:hypothetical protein